MNMMLRLLKFNSQINSVLLSLLVITTYSILNISFDIMSIRSIMPYIATVTFILVYRHTISMHYSSYGQAIKLLSSLPVSKTEIIKSHYLFNYLFIIILSVFNYLPSIFLRSTEEYKRIDTLGILILIILLVSLSYIITAPSIIYSPSILNSILMALVVFIAYGLSLGILIWVDHNPLPILAIDAIILMVSIFAHFKSVKVSTQRIYKRFG